jgi:hypothetical protein
MLEPWKDYLRAHDIRCFVVHRLYGFSLWREGVEAVNENDRGRASPNTERVVGKIVEDWPEGWTKDGLEE